MSSQKGNVKRSRPPAHKNSFAFKPTLNNTNKRDIAIANITVSGVCLRCKEQIEWKIKYKKYKPLTIPKKCVKCGQKKVKSAYHIMCQPCAELQNACGKCGVTLQGDSSVDAADDETSSHLTPPTEEEGAESGDPPETVRECAVDSETERATGSDVSPVCSSRDLHEDGSFPEATSETADMSGCTGVRDEDLDSPVTL